MIALRSWIRKASRQQLEIEDDGAVIGHSWLEFWPLEQKLRANEARLAKIGIGETNYEIDLIQSLAHSA